jgi:hypothetical protein
VQSVVRPESDAPYLITRYLDAGAGTTAPRDGTRIARVIGLLQRDDGATLDEVVAATGWQPHTKRAAFTGLRKRG